MDEKIIKQTFNYLQTNERFMSSSQLDFVKSLKKSFSRNKKLSEKQTNLLFEIAKHLKVQDDTSFLSPSRTKDEYSYSNS